MDFNLNGSPQAGMPANNLLRTLREEEATLLSPLLELWWGSAGDVLHEPGDTVRHVYFPCGSSMISYFVLLDDGRAVVTAMIGREGAMGGIVSQGRLPAFARAEIQFPGPLLRMELAKLEDVKFQSTPLRHLFSRYADCLMAQLLQGVACNAAHTIQQRAAKWLISAMDRLGSPNISLTHEQLAAMLGVGRSYISRIIGSLSSREILLTRRGEIVINNSAHLVEISCSCNHAVRLHFKEVLEGVYPV